MAKRWEQDSLEGGTDNGNVEHYAALKRKDVPPGHHMEGPRDIALSEMIQTQRL